MDVLCDGAHWIKAVFHCEVRLCVCDYKLVCIGRVFRGDAYVTCSKKNPWPWGSVSLLFQSCDDEVLGVE